MEIHQIMVATAYGDAITGEALALQGVLSQACPSGIFALNRDSRVGGVQPLRAYNRMPSAHSGNNILIFHASIGSPEVAAFLRGREERIILRYHNVTPAGLFRDLDPKFAQQLETGRQELTELREHVTLAVADSAFNASELEELGYERVVVSPLVMDYHRLTDAPRVPARKIHLPPTNPVVSFVGRVSPNKGHRRLMEAFHVLKTYLNQDAELYLAGRPHNLDFLESLDRYRQSLQLHGVHFTGGISNSDLVALYRRTDVFLCLSEHEGFCAPLIEAMGFDIPVVAWGATAVAETMGGAGIVLDSDDPVMAAEAVNLVLTDPAVRAEMVARGRQRFARFDSRRTSAEFVEAVLQVA